MHNQVRPDAGDPKKTASIDKSVGERAQAARRYAELLAESGVRTVVVDEKPVFRIPYTEELIPYSNKIREAEGLRKRIELKQSEIAEGLAIVFDISEEAAKAVATKIREKVIWREHDYEKAIETAENPAETFTMFQKAARYRHAAKKAMVWLPREKELFAAEKAYEAFMLMGDKDSANAVMEMHGLPSREMLRRSNS